MTKMIIKIGVIGSSSLDGMDSHIVAKARKIGELIAKRRLILLTGGGGGISHEVAQGAKSADGLVIGVSPASSHKEHVMKYKLPTECFDAIIYTGFGYKGRNVVLVRSSDALICISGGIGTLNELTIGLDEGKNIGILKNSQGISDKISDLLAVSPKRYKRKVVYEFTPEALLSQLLERVKKSKNF